MPTSEQQRLAAESLYRDANSLLYADNKPSEEAIDRVVGKINREYVHLVGYLSHIDYSFGLFSIDKKSKFSRKRPNQDDGDITYINERNRVFNKKVISNHTLAHPPLFSLTILSCVCSDCKILRQIHSGNPCQLRTWNSSVNPFHIPCFRTKGRSGYAISRTV